MMHVAVLKSPYIDLLLEGRKTMESRLSKTRREPFGCVAPGDLVLFKASGGPYRAKAIVSHVESLSDLTPACVRALRARVNPLVLGAPAYWHAKRDARYATLMTLEGVEPCAEGPALPVLAGRAWVCMSERAARRRAA